MYTEKDVLALLKAYKDTGSKISPKDFLFRMDKEDGWNNYDKKGASFDVEEIPDKVYLVRAEVSFPVLSDDIGEVATEGEIKKEFIKQYPAISSALFKNKGEIEDKLQVIKVGEVNNKSYTGTPGYEKAPIVNEPKEIQDKKGEEIGRTEVLSKKIIFEDGTSHILTYDVTKGYLDSRVDSEKLIETLTGSIISLIRSSSNEADSMKKTIDLLNDKFIDSNSETKIKNV